MATAFGSDRRVAVCRELTKLYEEVRRGTASGLVPWAEAGVKGEICIVAEGAVAVRLDFPAAVSQVRNLVAGGTRLRDASTEVAKQTGHPSRELYQAALAPARP
jgi:16S rRNA (cytidine1402-2'-O)-methyltransferase